MVKGLLLAALAGVAVSSPNRIGQVLNLGNPGL